MSEEKSGGGQIDFFLEVHALRNTRVSHSTQPHIIFRQHNSLKSVGGEGGGQTMAPCPSSVPTSRVGVGVTVYGLCKYCILSHCHSGLPVGICMHPHV